MRNTKYSLEPYQDKFISDIAVELKTNDAIIAQLSTGGGKTVVFASITDEFLRDTDRNVIIFVHRQELLTQTRAKLVDWYNLSHLAIDTNTIGGDNLKYFTGRVYVAMVETFDRRSKDSSFLRLIKNIGLVIIDEAHISNFKKIYEHFPGAKRIGFTATPIAATKKDPLRNYYSSIVIGCSIRELININKERPTRGIVQDITYTIDNITRANLEVKGEEFDEDFMGKEFSKKRQIQNTIDAYLKYGFGKKMLCFNANVAHSKLVTEEMCKAGLNARHLDAKNDIEEYRKECFNWLKKTPNAILCNVGIATTGFDEPSVEGVIINKATKSLTLYKQMCGRSARPYQYPDGNYKTEHIILDMGDNVIEGGHGEWSDETDWEHLFYHPQIPKTGKAPVKKCPKCECVNPAAGKICKNKECNFEFPIDAAQEDTVPKEMIRVTKEINVKKNIEQFRDRSEFSSYFETIKQVAKHIRKEYSEDHLDELQLKQISRVCIIKINEWFKLKNKRINPAYQNDCKFRLYQDLKCLGFNIDNSISNGIDNDAGRSKSDIQKRKELQKAVSTAKNELISSMKSVKGLIHTSFYSIYIYDKSISKIYYTLDRFQNIGEEIIKRHSENDYNSLINIFFDETLKDSFAESHHSTVRIIEKFVKYIIDDLDNLKNRREKLELAIETFDNWEHQQKMKSAYDIYVSESTTAQTAN